MDNETQKSGFAIPPSNYKFIWIGIAIVVFGFILMAGGRSDDPQVFNESMFSFRRIVIAPLVVLGGFLFEIYAIMRKPKTED
jgi:membrane-bound ClpP family serine protease